MPPWEQIASVALPALASVLGYKGQRDTNRDNRHIAREQMVFQERMSSTAAQRSMADYRAAGLNPALAYERSASSPGGASATMGNALAQGMSSAMAVREMQQALKQSREQHQETLRNTRASTQKMQTEAASNEVLTTQQLLNLRQQLRFAQIDQPYETRRKAAEAILLELEQYGAKNTAAFEQLMGRSGKGIATAKTVAEILKILSRSRRD